MDDDKNMIQLIVINIASARIGAASVAAQKLDG